MSKVYTYEEVAKHSKSDDCWIVIDNSVYDVSKFLDEHPGGDEIIFDLAGSDATESFVDIGHSDDALKILKTLKIGEIDPSSKPVKKAEDKPKETSQDQYTKGQGNSWIAIAAAIVFFAIGFYFLNE